MSGCVNCVYDLFQEELEEWSAAKKEADASSAGGGSGSVDDDGRGSELNWVPQPPEQGPAKHAWDEGLYADIPVGIREFMKTEKRLKEQHRQQGTLGG
ncbi:Sec14 cytosolic factor [Verticillium dahliae VDG1]|nr:Sec14 cytosolic factor [Verticillium dahliae VDG1]